MPSYTVRLTTGGTIYNLLTLVRVANEDFCDCYPMVVISADKDNSAPIYVGNGSVSSASYGFKLGAADDSITVNPPNALASLSDLNAVAGSDNQDLNILCVG